MSKYTKQLEDLKAQFINEELQAQFIFVQIRLQIWINTPKNVDLKAQFISEDFAAIIHMSPHRERWNTTYIFPLCPNLPANVGKYTKNWGFQITIYIREFADTIHMSQKKSPCFVAYEIQSEIYIYPLRQNTPANVDKHTKKIGFEGTINNWEFVHTFYISQISWPTRQNLKSILIWFVKIRLQMWISLQKNREFECTINKWGFAGIVHRYVTNPPVYYYVFFRAHQLKKKHYRRYSTS